MLSHTQVGSARFGARAMVVMTLIVAGLAVQGQEARPAPQGPLAGFPDLVAGLKATPGCLGVETARTGSGKNVIFAWFENKKAVLNWYYSDMHQGVITTFFPGAGAGQPLQHVTDDSGPILAIASLTLADALALSATKLPLSQIAIELYQPVAGGIALGGRFAPSTLRVPGLRELK